MGRLAARSFLLKGPARADLSAVASAPRWEYSKVLSKFSPTRAISRSERSHCLRIRALRTAASWRGLVPTRRMASASSTPRMVELKR